MNTAKVFPYVIALSFLPGAVPGAPGQATTKDSADFNHKYEGNVVPLPGYQQLGAFGTPPTTDGDIMTYRVPTGGGYWDSTAWDGAANAGSGWTIEFRIKIDNDFTEGSRGAVALYTSNGSAGDILAIGTSHAQKWAHSEIVVDTSDNTDDFHTFRVAFDSQGGVWPYTIYRDGQLLDTSPNGGNWGGDTLYFGSAGSYYGGPTVHLDYLRWDDTGAFAPPGSLPAVTFVDVGAAAGFKGNPLMHGQHSAWTDFNGDGWTDLHEYKYIWRNNGGTNFTYIGPNLGGIGVTGDYDNDGFPDIFCAKDFKLYRNVGGFSFSDQTANVPSAPMPQPYSAAWGDFDGDSFVDFYVTGYETPGYNEDAVYRNKGDGTFELDWTTGQFLAGRGVTACDFDEDGDLDVYVSNYRLQNNLLWLNDGNGNFTFGSVAHNALGGGGHTIGSAWGDLDNDGHIDLFVGNFAHSGQPESQFLENLGPAGGYVFADRSATAGLAWQESFASPSLADYDNDGYLDLFFTTVYGGDSCVLYRNLGNWQFADVTASAGLAGIGPEFQGNWADYDNDGDLDLVADKTLFQSVGNTNHWLKVRLEGVPPAVNRMAIGAQVRIAIGNQTQTRQVASGTGESNQNDPTLHFGMGSHTAPVDLQVTWPNGCVQMVNGVAVDQTVDVLMDCTVVEPEDPVNPCDASGLEGFIATQSPTGNPPDAARIYRADGTLVKSLPLGFWYQEFDDEGNLFVIVHSPNVSGDYPIYRYPYLGGSNWGDAELYALLDPVTNGTPEVLCTDTNGNLYVACEFPAARPNGMGIYRFDAPLSQPVFFAAMDDISGRQPKDMEFAPDGKLWMWIEVWGMLRWPFGGDTTDYEVRFSDAAWGGVDFGWDGNVYGCVDASNSDFGYYTINGAKLDTLFSDDLSGFYNMDFGPDRNGNGSCDIYIVEYYDRLGVYDGETGANLGDLFTGHPLRSVTGIVLPASVPGSYLILK
jgi:hypothetical protein